MPFPLPPPWCEAYLPLLVAHLAQLSGVLSFLILPGTMRGAGGRLPVGHILTEPHGQRIR